MVFLQASLTLFCLGPGDTLYFVTLFNPGDTGFFTGFLGVTLFCVGPGDTGFFTGFSRSDSILSRTEILVSLQAFGCHSILSLGLEILVSLQVF